MKIRVVLNWMACDTRKGMAENPLFRVFDMPCVPPVETTLHFETPEDSMECIDKLVSVKDHFWSELRPEEFGVETNYIKVDYTAAEFRSFLLSVGWTN